MSAPVLLRLVGAVVAGACALAAAVLAVQWASDGSTGPMVGAVVALVAAAYVAVRLALASSRARGRPAPAPSPEVFAPPAERAVSPYPRQRPGGPTADPEPATAGPSAFAPPWSHPGEVGGPVPASVPGVPALAPLVPAPAVPVPTTADEADEADEAEQTRLVQRHDDATRTHPGRAVAVLDDGRHLPPEATSLLGRSPRQRPDEAVDALLTVTDPAVSKTHLRVRIAGSVVYVTDRASTNGTSLVGPDGVGRDLEPWTETPVALGSEVRFGGRTIRVLLPGDDRA